MKATARLRRRWLIAAAFLLVHVASAQTAHDVLKAFRKLEASTEAGISYNDYARGMADVSAEMRSFGDAGGAGGSADWLAALRAAFAQYQKARTVWDAQQLADLRYGDGRISIRDYYDGKRDTLAEIDACWKAASVEIDRASKLLNRRR